MSYPPSGEGPFQPPGGYPPPNQPPGNEPPYPSGPPGPQPGPYGGGPYGAGPYGAPGPYGGMPVEHPQGTTILVLGILSLVVCGLLGPFAWSMGNSAQREIDQNPMAYTNRGSVVAGRICGIVATVLLIITAVFVVIAVIAAAGASSD
jgi:hypothetical protein